MMKKNINYLTILSLLFFFILIFKYNNLIKMSIINSCVLWFKTLVPSMFIMYLIVDLLLNYGLAKIVYNLFKTNAVILIIISLLLGTPANAKYIKEFYLKGLIDEKCANRLLVFSYSPNPLFVLAIMPNKKWALISLLFIYFTNFVLAIFMLKNIKNSLTSISFIEHKHFTECMEESIYKSFKLLILVLGIIMFYGVINSLIDKVLPNTSLIIKCILELTNALNIIVGTGNYKWALLAISFGGLSIHTQIKSILEDTPLQYKYFFYGRLLASLISLVLIFLVR